MDADNIHFTMIEIMIVKYFFKHYKDRMNSRQLAKALNINHAHANKLCNNLAKKMLLKKEDIGNARYFSFDYTNNLAIKFMEYLLALEEKEFPKWLAVVVHNLKKFNEHIQLGLIFGSSINKSRFNDIDVLLVYEKNKKKEIQKSKDEIRNAQLIEQPIRYVEITEHDIFLNKDDTVFYNVLSNSRIFCNAEKYVEVIKKCRR